jgi:hypothetical protein
MKLDDLEAQILGHTRREMAPSPEDASRSRKALAAELGAGALGTAATAGATSGLWASLGPIKAALLLATAVAGGGAVVGLSLRGDETPSTIAPATAAKSIVNSPRDLRVLPSPALEKPPSTPASTSREDPSSRRAAPTSIAENKEQPDQLAEEVRLLKRADQALRQGTPDVARELLEELARSYPKGQLLEERAATRTLLACQQTRDKAARAAARAFLSAHPASVYASRIRAACLDSPGE